ncbi:hypothetical protein Vadar_005239 [Vaccinium darrowii]|uniref:Uncharacterized protein n=1 Tax=Vaccinium darrowii TaxID=229202 RepID=A0ACB7YBS7_9ERIC|nr:hypothetical protein Vadar_005239 [Vaccinium darrowii]
MLALLLCSTLSYSARPLPHPLEDSPVETHHGGVDARKTGAAVEESCEGVGDEECLMRRTLAAHIDYIYTQKQKP